MQVPTFIRKMIKYSIFLLFYPSILLAIMLWKFQGHVENFPKLMLILPLVVYSFAVFFTAKKIRFLYITLIYCLFFTLAFLESAYLMTYHEGVSANTAYVILETNVFEAGDYLNQYFNKEIFALLLLFLLPSIFILIGMIKTVKDYSFSELITAILADFKLTSVPKSASLSLIKNPFFHKAIFILFVIVCATVYLKEKAYRNDAIYQLSIGYQKFISDTQKYERYFTDNKHSSYLKSVKPNNDTISETLIIVIGESSTRSHMSLYGYYRPTNPLLMQINDKLVAFTNVISPHTQTALSLEKIMTFSSTEHPENGKFGSIIQLVKQAGYKTFWISNQPKIGFHETLITKIARAADFQYFSNLDIDYDGQIHDEKLFPTIEKSLEDITTKKVIFIHLMGCHATYSNRYPTTFDHFKSEPKTKYKSKENSLVINQYDNAIRYNDFVLHRIISDLSQSNSIRKRLLYFSDHGEELYQSMNFLGHFEDVGSYPMFEIPFIFYSNQKAEIEAYKTIADRKYMADNFIYSVADLLQLNFQGMDETKSIFSSKYIPPKRIVLDDIDYDKVLNPNKTYNN